MIYETCGEDQETFENVEITTLGENEFHITYKEENLYEGMNFKVKLEIEEISTRIQNKRVAHYEVYDSVYEDDGEFDIDL